MSKSAASAAASAGNLLRGRLGYYEMCIGLEVHLALKCASKLLSGAPSYGGTNESFSAPNSRVALFDAAHPGTLPLLGVGAAAAGLRAAAAFHAAVPRVSHFERKHYSYADLPHGFQVTQCDASLAFGGFIAYEGAASRGDAGAGDGGGSAGALRNRGPTRVARIERLQLETDAGRTLEAADMAWSRIDLNRAGAALVEIVCAPDVRSARDAAALVGAIASLARAAGVGDAALESGGLRADVNVSIRKIHAVSSPPQMASTMTNTAAHDALDNALDGGWEYGDFGCATWAKSAAYHLLPNASQQRPRGRGWAWVFKDPAKALAAFSDSIGIDFSAYGEDSWAKFSAAAQPASLGFGQRVEYKNLNSLRAIAAAAASEGSRQVALIESDQSIAQETRSFDVSTGRSARLRDKNSSPDYRFLPEPDIPALIIPRAVFEGVVRDAPPTAAAMRRALQSAHGLDESTAAIFASPDSAVTVAYAPALAEALREATKAAGSGAKESNVPNAAVLSASDALALEAAATRLSSSTHFTLPMPLPPHGRLLARAVASWLVGSVAGALRDMSVEPRAALSATGRLPAHRIGRLVALVESRDISGRAGKEILGLLVNGMPGEPREIAEMRGLLALRDASAIAALAKAAVDAPDLAEARKKWSTGSDRALGAFIARVIESSAGRADPEMVKDACVALLGPCVKDTSYVGRKEKLRREAKAQSRGDEGDH